MDDKSFSRDLFMGFIKLHILYHAGRDEIFGLDMIYELERHGYTVSPGTLYPLLHKMQSNGFLKCRSEIVKGKTRKYYSITKKGKSLLDNGLKQALELIKELQEH